MSSAVDLLQHEEFCIGILPDDTQWEATWHKPHRSFRFCDGKGAGIVKPEDVQEWMPASVKF